MAKKSVEKTSEFDRLTKILVQKEAQIRELEEANAVIAKWRSLQEDKDGVIDQLKIEARKLISAPGTQVLIDSAEVAISVTMHQPPVTFDFEKAKKLWPAAIVEKS